MGKRFCLLLLIVLVISGCSLSVDTMLSPNGRYLVFFHPTTSYGFYGFTVFDSQTNQLAQQNIHEVPAQLHLDGISFEWLPSENYIVVVGDVLISSHGCDEMFVYTGDGRELVFSTGTTTSRCRGLIADDGLYIWKICPNDDIVYMGSADYRLTPSTGEYIALTEGDPYCATD